MSSTRTVFATLAIALFILVALPSLAAAQVQVAPTRLLIDAKTRAGEVIVTNPTEQPLTVTARFEFKRMRSDFKGEWFIDTVGITPEQREKSAQSWLRLFPTKFVLKARETRIVRVIINPPTTLADGEYWSRMIVLGIPVESPQPLLPGDTTEVVSTTVKVRYAIDIPVVYRKGQTQTGIEFKGAEVALVDSVKTLLVDLQRVGNSSYRGTLKATIGRSDGTLIGSSKNEYTAEFSVRLPFELPRLDPGTYSLLLESVTERSGSAADVVIPAPPVRRSFELIVAGSEASDITVRSRQ